MVSRACRRVEHLALADLVEGVEGMLDGRGCALLSAQHTGGEERGGGCGGRGQPGVADHPSQGQPAPSIHRQQPLNEVPGHGGHALPLWAHEGELAGLDPLHDLLCAKTLAVEGGVATQHRVL